MLRVSLHSQAQTPTCFPDRKFRVSKDTRFSKKCSKQQVGQHVWVLDFFGIKRNSSDAANSNWVSTFGSCKFYGNKWHILLQVPEDFDPSLLLPLDFTDKKAFVRSLCDAFMDRWLVLRCQAR